MSDLDVIDALRDAIQTTIRTGEADHAIAQGMVTEFVLVVEHIDADGNTWATTYTDTPHVSHTLGLLNYATERARRQARDEDGDT